MEILRTLGRGAAATIFLADVDGKEVAVKRPVAEAAELVMAAHRPLAKLRHPNLVAVLGEGVDDEGPHVLLEYVPGVSLDQLLTWVGEADELMPVTVVASIVGDIARGLSALAAGELVHRDISPANVIVGEDGVARVGDFDGCASLRDAGASARLCTPRYQAPELRSGDAAQPASDVFSLGAVLFEGLFGIPLAPDDNVEVSERLLDALEHRDDLPDAFLELLFGTLADDAMFRPSASQVADRLPVQASSVRRYLQSFATAPAPVPSLAPSSPGLNWHIKGAALAATVEYLVDRFGDQEYGRIVERLPDPYREQAQSPFELGGWYDGAMMVELTLAAETVFRSAPMKLARAIGAWSAERALSPGGPYQTFRDKGLRRGVRAFMEASEDIYGLYYDVGEWRILEIADNEAVCEITTRLPTVVEERIFAYLDRALELIGSTNHEVERRDEPERIWMRVRWR